MNAQNHSIGLSRKWIALLWVVSLLAGITAITIWSDQFLVSVHNLLSWIEDQGSRGQVVFVVALIVACIMGILPVSILIVSAGAIYGLWTGLGLSALGMGIGALSAFLISRYLFRSTLEKWISKRISLPKIDLQITLRGWQIVGLVRISPIAPFGIISYAFGLTRVRLAHYILGTSASFPALFVYVYSGTITGKTLMILAENAGKANFTTWIMILAGFVSSVILLVYLVRIAKKVITEKEFNYYR